MTHPSRANEFLKVYYLKLGLTSISALKKLFFSWLIFFMRPNQKLIQLQMKLRFNQNYAILAGSPWEETVGSRKGHYFGGSKASSSSSFTFILSPSLSRSNPSLPFSFSLFDLSSHSQRAETVVPPGCSSSL